MSKQVLFFENPYHLSTKNQQLIVESKKKDEQKQIIPINDIGIIILDNRQITFTQAAIERLTFYNAAVIFCNYKHLPTGFLVNLQGNSTQTQTFAIQIKISEALKKQLWKQIVETKIKNQAALLKFFHKNGEYLLNCAKEVKTGDKTNKEAQASRFYWQHIFDIPNFLRERKGIFPNNLLNYGYTVLRAATARALVASGLLPALGIFHHNKYDFFCLADDIMEAFRPFVDKKICEILQKTHTNYTEIDKNTKIEILQFLYEKVSIKNKQRTLIDAITTTTASLVKCYKRELKKIVLPILK